MDLRETQRPLKKKYREEPDSSRITLVARTGETETPINCSLEMNGDAFEAEAHAGAGGTGETMCSGDLLLGALAACAQITCQMVASAMNVPTTKISARAEGDMDLAGTLGISKDVPVGFENIRLVLEIEAPEASAEQLEALHQKTEQFCVIAQTLENPPNLSTEWVREDATG